MSDRRFLQSILEKPESLQKQAHDNMASQQQVYVRATLRSAITAALQDLIAHADESYYLLGTACGPAPYPSMNVFFQKIIGEEVQLQFQEKMGTNPDILIACVGGGSNSLGLFYDFLDDTNIRLMGVEA